MSSATATQTASVTAMLNEARALEGAPYIYGGGHGSTFESVAELKKLGLDCSAYVSAILHAGGYLSTPQDTTGLASSLATGEGKTVTVWDRTDGQDGGDHAFIDVDGHWFMEGGNPEVNPKQVAEPLTTRQAQIELAGGGFNAYHPTGTPSASSGGSGALSTLENVGKVGLAPVDPSLAASGVEGLAKGPAGDLASKVAGDVASDALGYVEPKLEQGVLYAVLIIGGVGLAGYGLIRMLAPTGVPQAVRTAATGAAVA